MKRLLIFGAVTFGLALGAKRLGCHCGGFDFEKIIEGMPENAPPRWMLRNISAIRENTERSRRNTERILELLESEHQGVAPSRATRRRGEARGPQAASRSPVEPRESVRRSSLT